MNSQLPRIDDIDLPRNFTSISLHGWRQFHRAHISFHPRLTVLTGANGCGKSTILNILGRHFNWNKGFSSEPVRRGDTSEWRNIDRNPSNESEPSVDIGSISYGTHASTPIRVPRNGPTTGRTDYSVELPTQQNIDGIFLTSHRTVSGNYVNVSDIPNSFAGAEAILEQYTSEIRNSWSGGYSGRAPQAAFKQALISAAVFGNEGNKYVDINPEARDIWHGFLAVLTNVMPHSIGFRAIRVSLPDVILETDTGDFVIDEASGGISAVLEIAWQIFLRSRTRPQFTAIIDEPENHLHPSLQREIMPSLLRAFPNVQFIVATHSPYLVTSTRDSSVFALDFNDQRRVESRQLDHINKAASANETLRDVLGVASAFPVWAEEDFARIVSEYTQAPITPEAIVSLRDRLESIGLAAQYPDAVLGLVADHAPGE